MTAAYKLKSLQNWLAQEGLDAFILPVADEYLSEYVPEHAMRLAWLTGFTGSAGAVVVTKNHAILFTDGRYTLQAKDQLDATLFQVFNSGELNLADWLVQHHPQSKIGYDPMLHSAKAITNFEKKSLKMVAVDTNPIDALWQDRPKPAFTKVWRYEDIYAGESAASKVERMAAAVQLAGADALFIAASENINWLLNIRGNDVECTPVVQGYALLYADTRVELFADPSKFVGDVLPSKVNVSVKPLSDAEKALADLSKKTLMLDTDTTPAKFANVASVNHVRVLEKADPIDLAKALKNPVELKHAREVHQLDGAALVSTFYWLQNAVKRGESVDEMLIDAMLEQQRSKQQGFVSLSFSAIVGAGPHGAIIHYRVTEATNKPVCGGELLLIDSGGQYLGGTTDVTRTLAIGAPTAEYIEHYTRVLKGHAALAMAVFPKGTTGNQLDALARQYLWQAGLDYDHGTGHGVGACLGVHEGPQRISKRGIGAPLEAGMIVSNEPGYYKNGSHGIRIENLVEVVERKLPSGSDALAFSNLTMVPYERLLIDKPQLNTAEIEWLNAYHANVYASLSGHVDADVQEWLKKACEKI